MPVPPRILVVDDEAPVRSVLERILKLEGFAVTLSATAKEGLQRIQSRPPDVLILDLNLPDMSGKEVYRHLRSGPQSQSVPIIILTGCMEDGLPAQCLEGGADDYLNKPFDNKELVARVRALLRRPRIFYSSETVIGTGRIRIHTAEHRVVLNGRPIANLAPKEFDLLSQLVLHSPKVLDKPTLSDKVWGIPFAELNPRTLDVHIRRIRQKIGLAASRCLKTIPSLGYQWIDNP